MSPFEKRGNNTIWKPRTKKEISTFIEDMDNEKSPQSNELSDVVQAYINDLGTRILLGNKLLTDSNKSYAVSLNAIIKKGINPVDIVVPVYGVLHDLKICLTAVKLRTHLPYRLIILGA